MNLCFPVGQANGLQSSVYGHFGSAPVFLIVDADTAQVAKVINRDLHHAHGGCSPLKALDGHVVDAVVVGGIGGGALAGLRGAGIDVVAAQAGSIADNLALWKAGRLASWDENATCGGHGAGHSCGHHPG